MIVLTAISKFGSWRWNQRADPITQCKAVDSIPTAYCLLPPTYSIPYCIFAAVTVFCSRHAIVIGPTPPGTGVMAPATSAHSA